MPAPRDLDDALARPGIELVIVGGPIESAGRGRCGAPRPRARHHLPAPAGRRFRSVLPGRPEPGRDRGRHRPRPAASTPSRRGRAPPGSWPPASWARFAACGSSRRPWTRESTWPASSFPRLVDVVRALLGDIEALTATGDPPGDHPDLELVVQLRAADARRPSSASGPAPSSRPASPFRASTGSLTLEFDPLFRATRPLDPRASSSPERHDELEPWDPHEAIFSVLTAHAAADVGPDPPSPNLHDGTRAMELAEATIRSLRRGRTVDLHYEPISEEASFKSVMTSTGCVIFLAALVHPPARPGRPTARLHLDDLHRVPDPANPCDLRRPANPPLCRAEAGRAEPRAQERPRRGSSERDLAVR